jgi:hypothetical protein
MVSFTPLPLYPRESSSVPIGQKARWAPKLVWTIWSSENSRSYWNSESDPSVVHLVASHYADSANAALCWIPNTNKIRSTVRELAQVHPHIHIHIHSERNHLLVWFYFEEIERGLLDHLAACRLSVRDCPSVYHHSFLLSVLWDHFALCVSVILLIFHVRFGPWFVKGM